MKPWKFRKRVSPRGALFDKKQALFTVALALMPLLHWTEPAFPQACPIPGVMTAAPPQPSAGPAPAPPLSAPIDCTGGPPPPPTCPPNCPPPPLAIITMGETNCALPDIDSASANNLGGQDAVLVQGGTLQSMSFCVTQPAGQVRLGIYDLSGSIIVQTAAFAPVAGLNTQ